MSIVLAAAAAAALANNALGVLALLAAPFWLPLCCKFVHPIVAMVYLAICLVCLVAYVPVTVINEYQPLPEGVTFVLGFGALMVAIGLSLGVLVAYSSQGKAQ
ncbi:MAG: hypothetical protein KDA57_04280 [Planctomycetales bacterium]|nr:hypothetical protein [Planctomycetales bacterium]